MKFTDMHVGDVAKIVNVGGEGQLRKRILDLGLTKGTNVTLVRIAPLGDPIEIELRGYRLTLRKTENDLVELESVKVAVKETPAKEKPEEPAKEAVEEAPAKEESE